MLGLLGAISNQATFLVTTATGSLDRYVLGLLERDQFNRANSANVGNNWNDTGGSISENRLVANGFPACDRHEVSMPTDWIMQCNMQAQQLTEFQAVYISENNFLTFETSDTNDWIRMRYKEGGNTVTTTDTSMAPIPDIDLFTVRLIRTSGSLAAEETDIYWSRIGQITDLTQSLAHGGNIDVSVEGSIDSLPQDAEIRVLSNPNTHMDEYILCGRVIQVTGLDSGFKARFIDATTTGSFSVQSSGTASLRVTSESLPLSRIEVFNGDDVLLSTFEVSGGIWGGDRYNFTTG